MWGCVCLPHTSSNIECASSSESQSADIRKRLITCGGPSASPGFIYTHPVNSAASELGWGPDHYLTIHSAVSQSYLKKWPWLNLWLGSSSLVKSQTLRRESSSAALRLQSHDKSVQQICLQNLSEKLQQGDWRSRNWEKKKRKYFLHDNMTTWQIQCLCECEDIIYN